MADGNGTALVESPRANGLHSVRVVEDVIPTLDTARFEHMQRIASVMARSSMVPDALCMTGPKEKRVRLEDDEIIANCFLVVNQAVRWGMDPFGVAQCVAVVHGKLCYEGKLVAAVLETKLGVRLSYQFNEAQGENLGVTVSGLLPGEVAERTVDGTVATWRTTGSNSPWTAAGNWKRQLRYRGAREWARAHAPAVMLGVYSDDELDDMADNLRAGGARDITPHVQMLTPPSPPAREPAKGIATGGPPPAPKKAEAAEPDTFADPQAYLAHIDGEMGACGDKETLDEVWAGHLETSDGRLGKSEQEIAEAHYERHLREIAPQPEQLN